MRSQTPLVGWEGGRSLPHFDGSRRYSPQLSHRGVLVAPRLPKVRFSTTIPEPNRACLVGVYAFLIWNNLRALVYQTPTKSYQSHIPVAFGIPGHVTTKHLPDTPC